jgi:hypothetical protein
MTVALSLCATQPLYAYCAGGVTLGPSTVYKCMNTCGNDLTKIQQYHKRNCQIICCPDGSFQYVPVTCSDSTWVRSKNGWGIDICCDASMAEGFEFVRGLNCSPAGE